MRIPNRMINALWSVVTRRDGMAFTRNAGRARETQEKRLLGLVERNRSTAFGREHGFSGVKSLEEFRLQVPIRSYEDFLPWVNRAASGEAGVLTTDRVLLFEPTGGTHGGTKLIPYTETLRSELRRAVAPWIHDLFKRFPSVRRGRGYWSISPLDRDVARTPGGAPIGFNDDSEYLGRTGAIIARTFVVPPELRFVRDIHRFLYLTAMCLLRAADLAIVSVWSPTMLTLLADTVEVNAEALLRDIRDGISLPHVGGTSLRFPRQPVRAAVLEKALSGPATERYARAWPNLAVVSCWTDSAAKMHMARVRDLFPQAHIQPKGLVATEGVVTIPLGAEDARVLAYTSHFFEFVSVKSGEVRCLDALERGGEYSVVITTGGGLYRYRLKDRVRVCGYHLGLPSLQFVGREETCDMVGEKLDEVHVRRVLQDAFAENNITPDFAMIAPDRSDRDWCYTLFIELHGSHSSDVFERVRRRVEEGLRRNFHYRYAGNLGQLKSLRLCSVGPGAQAAFTGRCLDEGQRLGDIKPGYLDRRQGWRSVLPNVESPLEVSPR